MQTYSISQRELYNFDNDFKDEGIIQNKYKLVSKILNRQQNFNFKTNINQIEPLTKLSLLHLKNQTNNYLFEIILHQYEEKLVFSIYKFPEYHKLFFCNVKQLKLKNLAIQSLQILQIVCWSSLNILQLPSRVIRLKSLTKCKFAQLRSLDMSMSKITDQRDAYRLQMDNLCDMKLPINRGNMLGLYLNYLKVRSINKRELYLNYLHRIPQRLKCMQQKYIQFVMQSLYVQ